MTNLQELIEHKYHNDTLSETEKLLLLERIGVCECYCESCPVNKIKLELDHKYNYEFRRPISNVLSNGHVVYKSSCEVIYDELNSEL